MKNIFITGATGNIGLEVIHFLSQENEPINIIAGIRQEKEIKNLLMKFPKITCKLFDFKNVTSFDNALQDIETMFLLRPPQIAEVEKYFRPLLIAAKDKGIKEIVFLSVQGVERSSIIPHHKIEKLIKELGFDYIFIRPSYFMQNLTTTLLKDITQKNKIILPAGNAVFNWVDAHNIGEVAAELLIDFTPYKNQAIELTGYENEHFQTVANMMSSVLGRRITYENLSVLRFYWLKRKEGLSAGFILVIIMLHFLPRFQKAPKISTFYETLIGKKPTSILSFLQREKDKFNAIKS
jgi:uncharacterized protein YbjT (DUF2867 family)